LRLDLYFRRTLYAVFAALFLTGLGWLWADRMKEAAAGDAWQKFAANLLMLHGGGAMLALMLLGALVPLHVQRGWRSHRNRLTGVAMLTFNGVLIATSFGLYYAGAEALRSWLGDVHIGVGLGLPVLFLIHILVGRRSSNRSPSTPVGDRDR
jgi:hypothetical protein